MPVSGNLTTITITDAELEARRAALHKYRAPEEEDWSKVISAGIQDALSEFVAIRSEDPVTVVPVYTDQWKRVIVYFTLHVIFSSFGDSPQLQEESTSWKRMADRSLLDFQYRVDKDEDSNLDTDEVEDTRSAFEVLLNR